VGLADAARDKAGAGCYSALSTAEESEEEAAALQRNLPDHFADHPVLSAPAGADALRRVTRALLRAAPAAAFASVAEVDTRAVAAFALLVYGAEQEEGAFWAAQVALSALVPPQAPPQQLTALAVELRMLDSRACPWIWTPRLACAC
jgi:hypothetical protein